MRKAPPTLPILALYPLFFVVVYLSHFTLLRLPYFWDEAGYYVPAAWDFFHTGTLIPVTTLTNAHPPIPSILLAFWWHFAGFVPSATRTLVCMVAAAALLAVFRLCRDLTASTALATTVTLLTAVYPPWFAQSTLAHADIFAAAFTLWALALLLPNLSKQSTSPLLQATVALLFSCAALSKETAIIPPLVLAAWCRKSHKNPTFRRWIVPLSLPVLPLIAWYAYHHHKTGYFFGNPEYLRYNATSNLSPLHTFLALWHRFNHLTSHMNLWVPMACTIAVLFLPQLRPILQKPARTALFILILTGYLEFSLLGGALLTRYLLPLYPLLLLLLADTWRSRLHHWWPLPALTAAAFLAAMFVNPPYAFAPEDNLTYRDMIVLHQQAASYIESHHPQSTVLTAWPATGELRRPELGYVHQPIATAPLENFALDQIQRAAQNPGEYDTALIFTTKYDPPNDALNFSRFIHLGKTARFDYTRDVHPEEVARLLHGTVVWHNEIRGEWAAVLRFPRVVNALNATPTAADHL